MAWLLDDNRHNGAGRRRLVSRRKPWRYSEAVRPNVNVRRTQVDLGKSFGVP